MSFRGFGRSNYSRRNLKYDPVFAKMKRDQEKRERERKAAEEEQKAEKGADDGN